MSTQWTPPTRREWEERLPDWWPDKRRRCVGIEELPWWLQRRLVMEQVVCLDGFCVRNEPRNSYRACLYPWPKVFRLL